MTFNKIREAHHYVSPRHVVPPYRLLEDSIKIKLLITASQTVSNQEESLANLVKRHDKV